jgi:hypothetical protein
MSPTCRRRAGSNSVTRLERVPDSRALYYSEGLGRRGGNWADGAARQKTRQTKSDGFHHPAKVRVAGSNPDFRSIVAGQRRVWIFGFQREAAG